MEEVFRVRDREGKAPKLAAALLAHAGAADLDRLVREVYRQKGKEWLAGFAPVVLRAAEKRDRCAGWAVKEAAGELAERAGELARRMGVKRPQWALTGGLFQNALYRGMFTRALQKSCPGGRVVLLRTPGEVGAARMVEPILLVGEKEVRREPLVKVEELPTERANPRSRGSHKKSVTQLVRRFVEEEAFTVRALNGAKKDIGRAAELVFRALKKGGRMIYVGAGTSGRLGVLDASEMPPTFHSPPEQVQAILAGGPEAIFRAQEGAEDDADAGARSVVERRIGRRDVLVGLTASGRTPFVHGALTQGSKAGASTILVTAHPKWKPESGGIRPNVVIRLNVGPELIAGSTRLKAGTVTKMVCNILSSVAMIRLGRVYDNLMVHVVPSNEKLKARAIRLVRMLTKVGVEEAERALFDAGGKVVEAVKKLKSGNGKRS
jgi:N-acetylmuramic acid 6-phosphate etherase